MTDPPPSAVPLGRRPERDVDGPFLFALFAASRAEFFASFDLSLREGLLRQQFAFQVASYQVRHPRGRFDILEQAGEPVGRLVTDDGPDTLHLVDIALLPTFRGRGLGTRLIRALQGEARSAGIGMSLTVAPGNEAALRLYLRLGFLVTTVSEVETVLRWNP